MDSQWQGTEHTIQGNLNLAVWGVSRPRACTDIPRISVQRCWLTASVPAGWRYMADEGGVPEGRPEARPEARLKQ